MSRRRRAVKECEGDRRTQGRRRTNTVCRKWNECRRFAGERESSNVCGGKRESGMEGIGRESRDPHPADSYNFNHQLATLLPPRGRVICEKHVEPQEEEGQLYSFISSYIFRVRDFPFFYVDARRNMLVGKKRRPIRRVEFHWPRDNVSLHLY